MNIEMEIKVENDINECQGFYTKKIVGQLIYATIRTIDELEELSNPTNYQTKELDQQYEHLEELQAIRKKMYNM